MERKLHNPPLKEDIADIYPQEGFTSYHAMSEWCHRNGLFVCDYVWDTRVVDRTIYYYFTEW